VLNFAEPSPVWLADTVSLLKLSSCVGHQFLTDSSRGYQPRSYGSWKLWCYKDGAEKSWYRLEVFKPVQADKTCHEALSFPFSFLLSLWDL
jgi:hypothetical protein